MMMKLKPIVILGAALTIVLILILSLQGMLPRFTIEPPASASDLDQQVIKSARNMSIDVKKENFLDVSLPENLETLAKTVKDDQKRVTIMEFDTFYREGLPPTGATPSGLTVVLLHGMNFKSQTWDDLGTFSLLAAMGHRVIAFDLPGYGNTPGQMVPEDKRAAFLDQALDALKVTKPIVVSPSMSGSFSLPFLFNFPGKMGGYVPVAPIFTEKFTDDQYKSSNTPTLVVYGELDEQLGELSTNNLKKLPNSQVIMLPKAKHPAYLDQPQMFHQLLYNFLLKMS